MADDPTVDRTEQEAWARVKALMGKHDFRFGPRWSRLMVSHPEAIAIVMARYKFAARMIHRAGTVLELGSGEGLGAAQLKDACTRYTGVESDAASVEVASGLLAPDKFSFVCGTPEKFRGGPFDAVVAFDVLAEVKKPGDLLEAVHACTGPDSVAVIGVPAERDAIEGRWAGTGKWTRTFKPDTLRASVERFFDVALVFGAFDEVVHGGPVERAPYLICVCCRRRVKSKPAARKSR